MNSEGRHAHKLMLILKGIVHRFQLSNRHFKGKQIFLRTVFFHFEVLKGVMENERLKN